MKNRRETVNKIGAVAAPASGRPSRRRDAGDETLTDIARSYNVSYSTISRL